VIWLSGWGSEDHSHQQGTVNENVLESDASLRSGSFARVLLHMLEVQPEENCSSPV